LGHADEIRGLAFGPDGLLASVSDDRTIQIWNVATSDLFGVPLVDEFGARAVAFSPDGATLATASFNGVTLWDQTLDPQLACELAERYVNRDQLEALVPDGYSISVCDFR
ncbi:MAG TPA: hypothetical protein VLG28_10475, partial [Acidimicrobiia bacterium]|nr:hypothetical protein [Acidimicrobiia bacterium]